MNPDGRLLYLVRHGETVGESSIRYHGRNDVALSDEGCRQVSHLVPRISELDFAAVVHSPLLRAAASARILVEGLSRPPSTIESDDAFTEVHFGRIEGMTDDEIVERWPDWHRQWKAGLTDGYPGGETFSGFAARIATAFDDALARHPAGDLLIVVHRGVIKWGLIHLLGLSQEQGRAIAPELGSLTILRQGRNWEYLAP